MVASSVYELRNNVSDNNWLYEVEDNVLDLFEPARQAVRFDNWTPLKVEMDPEESGRPATDRKTSDFPEFSSMLPAFSGRAWDLLRPLIGEHVQPLRLDCDDGEFWAINVLTLLPEVFDFTRSEYKRYPTSGRIMSVDRFVFSEPPSGIWPPIFRLGPSVISFDVFVTNRFKEAVEQLGLTGAIFKPVQVIANHESA